MFKPWKQANDSAGSQLVLSVSSSINLAPSSAASLPAPASTSSTTSPSLQSKNISPNNNCAPPSATSRTSPLIDSPSSTAINPSVAQTSKISQNSAQTKNTSDYSPNLNFSLKARLLLFFLGFLTLSAGWTLSPLPLEFKIVACDVGQGDAILIKYGSSRILIDSGPNEAVLECLSQEIFWLDPTIDVAVVTHWDADHIGGFDDVLQKYKVGEWLINPTVADAKIAQDLYSQIETRVKSPLAGDTIVWPGLEIRVLWSELTRGDKINKTTADRNLDSIALLIKGQSFGFFSAADLECPQQLAIIHSHLLNQAQIVKVAHHGAKLSSCPQIWSNLRPEVAILSVGQGNTYGHPHPETLDQLSQNGIYAWRTDNFGPLNIKWEPSIGWIMAPL